MTKAGIFPAALVCCIATAALAGQQPSVVVNDDDITIRGCVTRAAPEPLESQHVLVWTRGDIMLSSAMTVHAGQPAAVVQRVFYWLEDEDDLARHVGQMVEVKGELGSFETGELEIERDGAFTNIELELDGKTEKARVPTAWLGPARTEGEFDIAMRKVDVDDVTVVGPCQR
jgi:hypothetical protein